MGVYHLMNGTSICSADNPPAFGPPMPMGLGVQLCDFKESMDVGVKNRICSTP